MNIFLIILSVLIVLFAGVIAHRVVTSIIEHQNSQKEAKANLNLSKEHK